ncbi:MAG: IseA DL-endopeptidase inhibitor family protein [Ruminococcus sp.]|jgi:hypothetical protein|nr:IseA DL-endopeptidase inhibitor family protein [Ruminococcus sp.]
MKVRFIVGVLVIALGLSGCGTPETAEAIVTTAATTAATFEITTSAETTTTATETLITTTTEPTTTTVGRLLAYELNLNEFSDNIAGWDDYQKIESELSFLSSDVIERLQLGYILVSATSFTYIPRTGEYNSYVDEEVGIFHYGIDYKSFDSYLSSLFTVEMKNELINNHGLIQDIDGELCMSMGDRGSNVLYDYGDYYVEYADSQRIEIVFLSHERDGDIIYEPIKNNIVLVNENGVWKISEFEYWI